MNLKKIGKVFTSKSVGTGPSSYGKRIYRAAVSQRARNTDLEDIQNKQTNKQKIFSALHASVLAEQLLILYMGIYRVFKF